MVAVPLLAPAVLVSTPTKSALLVAPAASRLNVPPAVALPLALMVALRLSEKPSGAAVLLRLSACVRLPPTRWSASSAGLGVALLALASR